MTSHLDDGTIHELLDGEIPSAQLPPLQAHLAACAECRARLDSARELVDFSDELTGGGFKLLNPNAKQSCGCGKSFQA